MLLQIEGYSAIRKDAPGNICKHGVTLYVCSNIKAYIMECEPKFASSSFT